MDYGDHVSAIGAKLREFSPEAEWVPEVGFAERRLGFGATLDAHWDFADAGELWICDFKSREFEGKDLEKKGTTPKPYDKDILQIGAQAMLAGSHYGAKHVKAANLYFSRTHPGVTHLHTYTEDEVSRAATAFLHLYEVWTWVKGYDPRIVGLN